MRRFTLPWNEGAADWTAEECGQVLRSSLRSFTKRGAAQWQEPLELRKTYPADISVKMRVVSGECSTSMEMGF